MEIDKVAEIVLDMEVNRVTDEPDKVDAEVADTVQTSVEMAGAHIFVFLCNWRPLSFITSASLSPAAGAAPLATPV